MDDATLKIGTVIGAYRIVQALGAGGMGQVWLGEHQKLGRRAAIKVLHPHYSAQPEVVQRFFNEARAATAISDAGIVQIFDFGNHSDGSAYIVMELLDGEPLDRRLRMNGPLPLMQALRLIRQVAASLAAAHARGIVHRDLKPENIFVVRDHEVVGGERTKLLDFGIAKLSDDTPGRWKTSTSAVMGTPVYMSPEQCRGAGEVDFRSDFYSLGCVLFQLITGRLPFEAHGTGEIIAMHLRETPPAPSKYDPSIPSAVDELVLRCLAKEPPQRFSSGTSLAMEIDGLMVRDIRQAPTMAAAGAAVVERASPTTLTAAASSRLGPPSSSPRRRRFVVVALALMAIVGIGVISLQREGTTLNVEAAAAPVDASATLVVDAGVAVVEVDAALPAPVVAPVEVAVPAEVKPLPKPRQTTRASSSKAAASKSAVSAPVAAPVPAPPPVAIPRTSDVDGDGIPDRR